MEERPLSELLGNLDKLVERQRQIQSDWKSVGSTLKSARTAANLTQSDLQALTGISQPYIAQIENDLRTPSDEVVNQLAAGIRQGGAHGTGKDEGARSDARKARQGRTRRSG